MQKDCELLKVLCCETEGSFAKTGTGIRTEADRVEMSMTLCSEIVSYLRLVSRNVHLLL